MPSTPLNNTVPIDQHDLKFDALLANLQGNILKSHGRDHTAHIFVEFHPTQRTAARAWIREFGGNDVTSAKKQLREIERFKQHGVPGELFVGLYLSAAGLTYFNVDNGQFPADPSFQRGMENAGLNDPARDTWESTFKDLEIHALILLADDDKVALGLAAANLLDELRPLTLASGTADPFISHKIGIEYGNAIRNENGDGLEHFGYVDGISQPLFFEDEYESFKKSAKPSPRSPLTWDPFASLSLVLVQDSLDPNRDTNDSHGSYFVFRKLEQNVRAFKEAENQLAKNIGLPQHEKERAGALIVGRFEDGTPVTLSRDDGMIGSGSVNNFDYSNDIAGNKCPFQAHIRKSNPRGSGGAEPLPDEKKHIMARRGIPYGQREVSTAIEGEPEQFPTGGVGLLFQSFQADLANQFEFIQRNWVDNPSFPFSNPAGHTGIDPLIGQAASASDRDYDWPTGYNSPNRIKATFGEFVHLKGGQYFYAPSIEGLKNL